MKTGIQSFINKYDPLKLLQPFIDICNSINKLTMDTNYTFFKYLKAIYIVKVKYPLFRRKVKKFEDNTAIYLLDHPNWLVFILSRYLTFFGQFCSIFNAKFEDILDKLFNKDEFAFTMETKPLANGYEVTSYNMIIRSMLPKELNTLLNNNKDVYIITKLEADLDSKRFNLSQVIYDTTKLEDIKTAKCLSNKEFILKDDGMLYNPNYAIDQSLLEEDLLHYRFMISHIMGCVSELFSSLLILQFVKIKN